MNVTIFAKNRKTKEGKSFIAYIGRLRKKDGTETSCSVKFKEDCGAPNKSDCPMIIGVEKSNANMSTQTYIDEASGTEKQSFTLWVDAWSIVGEYVDNSLDEYED